MESRGHIEAGQAIVEAAILLPLWVGCLLGVLQLVLLQEARLLTEYAAYQSARSGIVWNGDPRSMGDAARFVLAPTACPSRSPEGALLCVGGKGWSRIAAGIAVLDGEGLPSVQITTDSPDRRMFPAGELDFDKIPEHEREREAGLLSIRLLYWFELKIPFVDAVLWQAWQAATAGPGDDDHQAAKEAAASGRYFVPIASRQVMRMQSNRYERHLAGCACEGSAGCHCGGKGER